jgi:predicted metalloprotease
MANSPDIAKYYIQQHNIKKRITKTLELNEKIKQEKEEEEENTSEKENIKLKHEQEQPQVIQLQDIIQ